MQTPAAKPHAPATERNREPLRAALLPRLTDRRRLLEIGSGTGQHAVFFAPAMPHLLWQTSERPTELPGLRLWLDEAACPNTPAPLDIDVMVVDWPERAGGPVFDAMFSANTLHIMPWEAVQAWFSALPRVLKPRARLCIYGPFFESGRPTAESNLRFDASLREKAPHQGLRALEAVDALAAAAGLQLRERVDMPANNLLVVWDQAPS
jgi:cyclopropane fatty-acyl-phospholipid synthase-like methyltransferase